MIARDDCLSFPIHTVLYNAKGKHARDGLVNVNIRSVISLLASESPLKYVHLQGAHVALFSIIAKHFLRHSSFRSKSRLFAYTTLIFTVATLGITLQFICDVQIYYGEICFLDVEELFVAYTPENKLSVAVTLVFVVVFTSEGRADLMYDNAGTSCSNGLRTS